MIYLILALLGLVFPYYFFISFINQYGLNLPLFVENLFANKISTFFAVDLLITAVVFLIFSYREAALLKIKNWWLFFIFTLTIGPSFAFPIFLFVREKQKKRMLGPVQKFGGVQ